MFEPNSKPLPFSDEARIATLSTGEALSFAIEDAFRHEGRESSHFDVHDDSRLIRDHCDVIFITVDSDCLRLIGSKLTESLAGTVAVICTTSVRHDSNGFYMASIPDGSVTNLTARLFPNSRIVGAMQQFTHEHIELASMGAFHSDAPIIGDDLEAVYLVEALIEDLRGFDPVYMGGLHTSEAIEGMTAVIREAAQYTQTPAGFRLSNTGFRFLV